MVQRFRINPIFVFLPLLTISAQIFAAKVPPQKRTFNPIIRKLIEYALPDKSPAGSNYDVQSNTKGNTPLGLLSASTSPGIQLGSTYYDQQHVNTTGRMVGIGQNILGSDTNTYVHFTWMTGPTPITAGRTGAYVNASVGTGVISVGEDLTSAPAIAGYFNLDVTPDNRAVISGHYTSDGNTSEYAPTVWYDSAALEGNFKYVSTVADTLWQWAFPYTFTPVPVMWPHLGFQTMPDGSHVTHLTGAGPLVGNTLLYFRKHGNTPNLAGGELSSCPALSVTGWDCPWAYDTAWATVALITASKQSGKVALIWTANLPDYTATPGCDTCSVNSDLGAARNIYENDVYFQMSNNYGVSWNPMQNVTHDNAATADWMPYNDIDAMWDENDELHIAWVATDWKRYREENFIGYGARIYHWTEDFGNTKADTNARSSRVAVQRREDPILCNAGSYNLNLAKLQLSECNNNLYCLFVDLWDGHNESPGNPDCSKSGYDGNYNGTVNGELMVSISDDNGLAWDLPHNLTNTSTPNCDSVGGVVGPCDNDHWPSMPPHGFSITNADGAINGVTVLPRPVTYPNVPGIEWLPVMYINDLQPGVAGAGEGSIRDDPVRTFYMACVDPDQIGWGLYPCYGLGFDIGWPTFVHPGEQLDLTRVLENIGNAPLYYNLIVEEDTGPAGWLSVSGALPFIAPGVMNKDTVTIHLNTGGIINSEAIVYGRIILTEVGSFDACTVGVELIVSVSDILLRNIDTISTGLISLAVANNGQFGLGSDAGQSCVRMDYFCGADCDKVDSIPGDTRIYLYDGSIIVGGIVNGDTILSNQIYSQGFEQESSIYPLTAATGPTINGIFQYWRSGILTNHDTTLGMEISYYAPQVTQTWGSVAGKTWHADQQFITREFKVWSMDGLPHDGLAVGEVVDWDIPSDSGNYNGGGFDWSRRLLFTNGAEYNLDNDTECQDNDHRYGGMAFGYFKRFNSVTNRWTIVDSIGLCGYHGENSIYVYPGWNDNELYANMETFANCFACDFPPYCIPPIADLHSVLTYAFDYDLFPDDTLVFYSVLATVREDQTGPTRIMDLASKGRNFTRYFACCRGTRGDLNGDGADCNILDLTYGVDRMFRGGPVATCAGEGDVNRDKTNTDILDITFMVDRIFRGGPAPASCSTSPSL